MSRGLSVAEINAAAAPHRVTVALMEMYFASGTLNLAVFPWDLTIGATTYTRAPVTPSTTKESAVTSEGIELHLSGFDPAIMTIMASEAYHGRTFRLLKGFVQPDSNQIIGTPKMFYAGRMRNMIGTETNDKVDVGLYVEHYDLELQRPMPLRYADADQQRLFPGDLGCQYTARNSDKTVIWPSKEAQKYTNGIFDNLAAVLRRRLRGGG